MWPRVPLSPPCHVTHELCVNYPGFGLLSYNHGDFSRNTGILFVDRNAWERRKSGPSLSERPFRTHVSSQLVPRAVGKQSAARF